MQAFHDFKQIVLSNLFILCQKLDQLLYYVLTYQRKPLEDLETRFNKNMIYYYDKTIVLIKLYIMHN